MPHYMMYPAMYIHPTFNMDTWEKKKYLVMRWPSITEAVNAAKETRVCLREKNWFVYELGWFPWTKKRISLEQLSEWGLISKEKTDDFIGSYYHFL